METKLELRTVDGRLLGVLWQVAAVYDVSDQAAALAAAARGANEAAGCVAGGDGDFGGGGDGEGDGAGDASAVVVAAGEVDDPAARGDDGDAAAVTGREVRCCVQCGGNAANPPGIYWCPGCGGFFGGLW